MYKYLKLKSIQRQCHETIKLNKQDFHQFDLFNINLTKLYFL